MNDDRISRGIVPAGATPNFTDDAIPEALQREHNLAAGRWGVLHALESRMVFVDLGTGRERNLEAPDLVVIRPGLLHKMSLDGPLTCRIDFFSDLREEPEVRTPGKFADETVRMSLERCEASGEFPEVFCEKFLNSSPEVPPLFSGTDFQRQKKLLRDSVHKLVSRDVSDPILRRELEHLGRIHGRRGRNIRPALYELWLDSLGETAEALDPEWNEAVEQKRRVRLRPGMQIIMAAY